MAPPLQYDFRRLDRWVETLTEAAEADDDAAIYKIFSEMEIGFHPAQLKNNENVKEAAGVGAM